MNATSVIDRKLAELADEERRVSDAIAANNESLKIIRAQRAVLQSLVGEIQENPAEAQPSESGVGGDNVAESPEFGGLKPAEAVKSLLRMHPTGLPQKAIVERLEGRIRTSASDPRRLLYNTIFNLRRRHVVRDAIGPEGGEVIQLIRSSV